MKKILLVLIALVVCAVVALAYGRLTDAIRDAVTVTVTVTEPYAAGVEVQTDQATATAATWSADAANALMQARPVSRSQNGGK